MADLIYGGPPRQCKRVPQRETALPHAPPESNAFPRETEFLMPAPLHVSQLACALALQAILAERSPLSRTEIATAIPTLSAPDRLIDGLVAAGVLRLTPVGRKVELVPDSAA
jgi:hypothetical protein